MKEVTSMLFFHCTHHLLTKGCVIEPGNWGKKLFEVGASHNAWNREMALEETRKMFFPNKPSRLTSCFVCDSLATIQCYKSKHCPTGHIYRVEIIDENAPLHKGDFNAVEPLPRHSADMSQIAQMYWQYALKTSVAEWPQVECSEILVASSLRVLEHLPYQGNVTSFMLHNFYRAFAQTSRPRRHDRTRPSLWRDGARRARTLPSLGLENRAE